MVVDEEKHQQFLLEYFRSLGAEFNQSSEEAVPLKFSDEVEEHLAVKTSSGIFDMSQMGKITISGHDAERYLNHLLSVEVSSQKVGEQKFTLVFHEDGTLLNAGFLGRLEEECFLFTVHPAFEQETFLELSKKAFGDVSILSKTKEWSMLAVQGPTAPEVFTKALEGLTLPNYHHIEEGYFVGEEFIVSRSGYTRSDGFEVIFNRAETQKWHEWFVAQGAIPCGSNARESLRLEAGLIDVELDLLGNVFEASLDSFIDFSKEEFQGSAALLELQKAPLDRKICRVKALDERNFRQGEVVKSKGGVELSKVTSAVYSPCQNACVGWTYLPVDIAQKGIELEVGEGTPVPAVVI